MKRQIDINIDVGEGIGNESQLMPLISSCNIACGGHAGDLETMDEVVQLAKKHRVKVGAHPSFPDKEHFGRKIINMPCIALYTSIKNQIKELQQVLVKQQVQLHHIKPHGALYNLAAVDEKTANVIIEVIKGLMIQAKLYVPYNSVIEKLAKANNIPITYEAFGDRNYNADLTLVSRLKENALIEDTKQVFEHVFNMVSNNKVSTVEGKNIKILVETICFHGDNPRVVQLVSYLKDQLEKNGVKII